MQICIYPFILLEQNIWCWRFSHKRILFCFLTIPFRRQSGAHFFYCSWTKSSIFFLWFIFSHFCSLSCIYLSILPCQNFIFYLIQNQSWHNLLHSAHPSEVCDERRKVVCLLSSSVTLTCSKWRNGKKKDRKLSWPVTLYMLNQLVYLGQCIHSEVPL